MLDNVKIITNAQLLHLIIFNQKILIKKMFVLLILLTVDFILHLFLSDPMISKISDCSLNFIALNGNFTLVTLLEKSMYYIYYIRI